ncbi:hypothetical protein CVT26_006045 [Gymnopilus dilepis]|uniref:Uncharacterized protein n=1 Tax=Gymnopilus dilepis TaxID=231916 RepID=A0A409VQE8_9AGAR|nr:hypothetical protein CVT26_006045 [Gymnopilus dilepis]
MFGGKRWETSSSFVVGGRSPLSTEPRMLHGSAVSAIGSTSAYHPHLNVLPSDHSVVHLSMDRSVSLNQAGEILASTTNNIPEASGTPSFVFPSFDEAHAAWRTVPPDFASELISKGEDIINQETIGRVESLAGLESKARPVKKAQTRGVSKSTDLNRDEGSKGTELASMDSPKATKRFKRGTLYKLSKTRYRLPIRAQSKNSSMFIILAKARRGVQMQEPVVLSPGAMRAGSTGILSYSPDAVALGLPSCRAAELVEEVSWLRFKVESLRRCVESLEKRPDLFPTALREDPSSNTDILGAYFDTNTWGFQEEDVYNENLPPSVVEPFMALGEANHSPECLPTTHLSSAECLSDATPRNLYIHP